MTNSRLEDDGSSLNEPREPASAIMYWVGSHESSGTIEIRNCVEDLISWRSTPAFAASRKFVCLEALLQYPLYRQNIHLQPYCRDLTRQE